ncbi:MAG TPA: hypothetical protein VGM52_02750 [Herbaspirillum sp.]
MTFFPKNLHKHQYNATSIAWDESKKNIFDIAAGKEQACVRICRSAISLR